MSENKGTGDANKETSPGKAFLLREAECSDDSSDGGDYERMFDGDTDSDSAGFIDDEPVDQGNSEELHHRLESEDSEQHLQVLKRKFIRSPKHSTPVRRGEQEAGLALSPILEECRITPNKAESAKKRICFERSSKDEASSDAPQRTLDCEVDGVPGPPEAAEGRGEPEGAASGDGGADKETIESASTSNTASNTVQTQETQASEEFSQENFVQSVLKGQHTKAKIQFKANEALGCGMHELCRVFRSGKTMAQDWVIVSVGVREHIADAAHEQLKRHCTFILTRQAWGDKTPVVMQLVRFKHQKNRDGIINLFKTLMAADAAQILCNPPRINSAASALYWYKAGASSTTVMYGEMLEWIRYQTEVAHQMAAENNFDLSQMIQWALDNDMDEESKIALNYAMLADEEKNALAFLKCNNQARYVRDCCHMVRLYKRGIMQSMSMPEWIAHRNDKIEGETDGWRKVVKFLRYQGVELYPFLMSMKYFLQGVPKKSCLVIEGPPDTGKSMFGMSLIKYMAGKVVSFQNHRSHFWVQPLIDAKMGLIDDCTDEFWKYCDTYLRNALDGNPVSIDTKHKNPVQLRFPPMVLTTNVYLRNDPRWAYLISRVKFVTFPNVIQNVERQWQIQDSDWKSFFRKFKIHLELQEVDKDTEDGPAREALRVSARRDI